MPKKAPTKKAAPKKSTTGAKKSAARSTTRKTAASSARPTVTRGRVRATNGSDAATAPPDATDGRSSGNGKAKANGNGNGAFPQSLHDLLGVAEDPLVAADPVSFLRSLGSAALATTRNPGAVANAGMRFAAGTAGALQGAASRLLGKQGEAKPNLKDKRFADEAFANHPYFYLLHQMYLVNQRFAHELLDSASLDPDQERKARFAAQFLLDALAPTNTLAGNPAALRRAMQTGGRSVAQGLRNMMHDVRHNGGWPSQVDSSGFKVGENMAITPGKVVYRSDLIELIQYEAQTDTVYETPLLFCPPWINKYYIMDLAPQKSLIEWAIQHGHTCFAISYRNPDESMRETTFEDYLMGGPLDAVRVVR
jgi:polyhydroxyalkanoate synthase